MTGRTILPVVLSGGAGTRLWPLSRSTYPKQLLALNGETSLLQQTVERAMSCEGFVAPLVVSNQEQRFILADQLQEMGIDGIRIVLEPVGRNTAPAIAAACLIAEQGEHDFMVVLPSDHAITKADGFRTAMATAVEAAARSDCIVTIGVRPDAPETGYGYIKHGAPLDGMPGCYKVEAFVEKPDLERAKQFLADGGYEWNSGMFVFPTRKMLNELERHAPDVLKACRKALDAAQEDLDFLRLDETGFAEAPSISIDYAVMEKTPDRVTVQADLGWSDLGSFEALWKLSARNAEGNALIGDVVARDTSGTYVRADKRLVAVQGVKDLVVIDTADAVLVADRTKVQDVGALVKEMAASGRNEPLSHLRVRRPWGYYEPIDAGPGYQVKHICVFPGKRLSLQKHFHRAEHWVVVEGEAVVTRGEDTFVLEADQSTYIPAETVHRLENKTDTPMRLIEVQSGAILSEDDIVRLEDDFGRGSPD